MKLIETIISIITPLLGVLLPLFWNKLKGYRTKILSFLTIGIGFLAMISESVLPKIAELFSVSVESLTATIVVVLGFLQYVFRLVTDTPAGQFGDLPQKFRAKKK